MPVSAEQMKKEAAQSAVEYILKKINSNDIIGVGTGSTADLFIDYLAPYKDRFKGAVASSNRTAERLQKHGVKVFSLNEVTTMPVYIDGADEINFSLQMIKGGGGALTREKIVASVAQEFVCMVDESKWVEQLGNFHIPIEVIDIALESVSRQIIRLGAKQCKKREGFLTDNGHPIIDVAGFLLKDGADLEAKINQIPGVVTCGLFALNPASYLIMGTQNGVINKTLE